MSKLDLEQGGESSYRRNQTSRASREHLEHLDQISEGVQSSNILSFCVKKIISQAWLVQKPFFHPDIVQPKY